MSTLKSWKVLEPDGYYRSFIDSQKRPDGRQWMEARPISLRIGSVSTAEGSAAVRFGATSVVCGVKAELAVPSLKRPSHGFIVPNVELHPCCSPAIKAGPPGEKAMVTSQFLANIIKSCNLIDLTSLCIEPNKVVWCLYCDVVCVDFDGNLTDAALLAVVAALKDVKLPKVSFDQETEKISVQKKRTEALNLKAMPTSTTFTSFSPDIHLLDPSAEDEKECSGEVTIVLKDSETVCLTHKSGGFVLAPETLQGFMDVAKVRGKELQDLLAVNRKRVDTG